MKHLILIIACFLISLPALNSQEKGDSVRKQGKVYLSLKNINFIKNDEYFHPIIEGYTLIGYFIQPSIIYAPSEKLKLKLGAHILNYAGAGKISQTKIVFSTTYNFSENTFVTVGTLNGSDEHRMADPLFDYERLYNSYVEDGFQFTSETKHIFSDYWLSWENFIFKGDTTREVLTSGESFSYTSGKIGNAFTFKVPVQIMFKHFGGQISNYSEHIETYFNLSTGLGIEYDIAGKRFGTAGIEYLQFYNDELTRRGPTGITKGYASWIRFHYNYKAVSFGSYYWNAHNFYAPNGNPIYSSVSSIDGNPVIPDRRVWTNSIFLKAYPVEGLEIFVGFDAFYDLNLKRFDTAFGLHLRFDKLIRLASLKN